MDVLIPVGAAIGKAAVTFCANKVLGAVAKMGGDKAVKILAKFKVDSIAGKYHDKIISRILTFKTLNGDGKDVKLNEIYYPLGITRNSDLANITINNGVILKFDGCICITGSAGQGKTTIMRKLFVEELIFGERFPFFLTLRDVDFDKKKSCVELLLEHLNDCGIDCINEEVTELVSSGKIIIFFDGFDEINQVDRLKALKVIENLHLIHSCPSIITTRPDTELANVTGLECYKVNKLSWEDIDGIIRKVVHDTAYAKTMLNTLEGNSFIRDAISTPILVSIFILTYDSFNDEPKNITDFYDTIFSSLIFKHDKSKNFKRIRLSSLNNHKLEECFSIFSFLSLADGISTFTDALIRKYFHDASKFLGEEESSENLMYDIISGTNLVVIDGHDRYVYIHRSIQEYFAAKCISVFDEENKEEFYTNCIGGIKSQVSGRQVLMMLSSIDSKAFAKFFVIPLLISLKLLTKKNMIPKTPGVHFKKFLNNAKIKISFNEERRRYEIISIRSTPSNLPNSARNIEGILGLIDVREKDCGVFLHEYFDENIDKLIGNLFSYKGISEEEFRGKYSNSNTFHDNNEFIDYNNEVPLLKISDLFPGGVIPGGFLSAFSDYYAGKTSAIAKYIDNNHFIYKSSAKIMVSMLRDARKQEF